jgi:hypothetical protein
MGDTVNHVLSEHARTRCASRGIDPRWIADALKHAPQIENDADDASLAHALWPLPDGGFRVLRVIFNETVDPVAVVTAYFDNKVSDL